MGKFLNFWYSHWRAYLAEFLGTFVFVLTASGTVLANIFYGGIGTIGVALSSGLALGAMIWATAHISGGHLNPAVTVSLWLTRKIGGIVAIFYILAQLLASLAAAWVILGVFGQRALEFDLGGPKIGTSLETALVLEIIFSAVLVFAVFATMVDRKGPASFGPLVVGLVVVVATLAAGSLSGAVLNPARVFGPAMFVGSYQSLVIWTVGPLSGALFGLIYDFLFLSKVKK